MDAASMTLNQHLSYTGGSSEVAVDLERRMVIEKVLVCRFLKKFTYMMKCIFPIEQTRKIRPISGYGQKIAVKGDIFADDSDLWENA